MKGRKKLPEKEKKKQIRVFVKSKAHAKAKKHIKKIADDYNAGIIT